MLEVNVEITLDAVACGRPWGRMRDKGGGGVERTWNEGWGWDSSVLLL